MTLTVLLFAAPARADATSDARELYDRAVHAYNKQEWADALDRFQAAYDAVPAPALLFNIGQCQRQLGKYAAAAHSYRAYLAQVPDGGDRAAAERLAAQMDAAAAGAKVAPKPATAAVSTFEAPVIVEHRGGAVSSDGRARRRRHLAAGLGVLGAGAALAITGAALLGVGASDDGAARRASMLPEQRRLWDTGGQLQIAGIVTLAASGIGFGVGGLLLAKRR